MLSSQDRLTYPMKLEKGFGNQSRGLQCVPRSLSSEQTGGRQSQAAKREIVENVPGSMFATLNTSENQANLTSVGRSMIHNSTSINH
jgi:hypothetical protein